MYFEVNLEDLDTFRTTKTSRGYVLALSQKPRLLPDETFDVGTYVPVFCDNLVPTDLYYWNLPGTGFIFKWNFTNDEYPGPCI